MMNEISLFYPLKLITQREFPELPKLLNLTNPKVTKGETLQKLQTLLK